VDNAPSPEGTNYLASKIKANPQANAFLSQLRTFHINQTYKQKGKGKTLFKSKLQQKIKLHKNLFRKPTLWK
jgi:hypothetical protein